MKKGLSSFGFIVIFFVMLVIVALIVFGLLHIPFFRKHDEALYYTVSILSGIIYGIILKLFY